MEGNPNETNGMKMGTLMLSNLGSLTLRDYYKRDLSLALKIGVFATRL